MSGSRFRTAVAHRLRCNLAANPHGFERTARVIQATHLLCAKGAILAGI